MKIKFRQIIITLIVIAFGLVIFVAAKSLNKNVNSNISQIQVVAGENFWGSLVSQIGGNKVNVVQYCV